MKLERSAWKILGWSMLGLAALACSNSNVGGGVALSARAETEPGAVTQGMLVRLGDDVKPGKGCPLKHTDVKAEISGFLSRVTVVQQFENPFPDAIEAVYVFPLPQNAAVDDMTMRIGDRVVKGKIKRREEARAIYEAAKAAGALASLLDQERPNIFTQSVANIPPGAKVEIEISYVETLKYEEGRYEFSFPMVVGPRYIPGNASGRAGGSRITPPVTPPGTRAGHDISLEVTLDAGVPVRRTASKTHEIDLTQTGENTAKVRLEKKAVLPNKDFVLTYDVAGAKLQDAVLAHHDERGGFFTLILQPPERVTVEDVTPKELVFVLDTSGSMSGFPIEKAKEVIKLAIDGLYPRDRFNLITFAGRTKVLFPEPVAATNTNVRRAQEFLASRSGGGGTEMMTAIRTALAPSDDQDHVRIVCFLTDGYVGNDMAILGKIRKHPNARVFSFGVGSSVNRFLLDKMAEVSRGEVAYVGLNEDGSLAARRFHERIRNPLLTDVEIDWSGLPVTDVYPRRIPDLFSAQPVIVTGRYTAPASGSIRLRGKMSGEKIVRTIPVRFAADAPKHDVLATLWARKKVDDLMTQDWAGMQNRNPRPRIREAITKLGLDFRLMTQFTSFVAVEVNVVVKGGVARRVEVPVEMPAGVSYEGVFGDARRDKGMAVRKMAAAPMLSQAMPSARDAAVPSMVGGAVLERREQEAVPERDVSAKLHPDLVRLAAGAQVSGMTMRGSAVRVEIWLVDARPELLRKLKTMGFQVSAPSKLAKVVIGWLPVAKLTEVAKLDGVRYVTPYRER